jgi:2-oxopent-4-enoate/cis-2-oxohex-4-enoate hydratase
MRPALEAEVAVWLCASIAPDGTEAAVAHAVTAWAPAIEIVDFDRGFDDLEAILEAGVFHRAVVLGEPTVPSNGANLEGHRARVEWAGNLLCEVDAREATGNVASVLLHLARLLAPYDEALRKDDIVILGSMNPLTIAKPGEVFAVSINGIGHVEVALSE